MQTFSSSAFQNTIKRRILDEQYLASMKDFPPSADTIRAILISEQELLLGPKLSTESLDTLDKMARFYELTYAFVDAFQRRNIPILVGSGSHIGARRHHGEREYIAMLPCIVLSMDMC